MNGIYGKAATGLSGNTSWAVSEGAASIGARGEKQTEDILNRFGAKAAVIHDLKVPIPGSRANIDHIIVSGKRVLILDTKVWLPGFYWTLAGRNRRGFTRIPHTEKPQHYITDSLRRYLDGTGAKVGEPYLVVWPSNKSGGVNLWMLRVPGAGTISGPSLAGTVRSFITRKPADPVIVNKLKALCTTGGGVDGDPFAE